MDEYFLHFLWQYQKFNRLPLKLSDGSELVVHKTGHHNHNAGPDFLEAKVKIDKIEWSGSVEIHYRASDWNAHNHQNDPAYANVILHVVWENDKEILYKDRQAIPTLVMSEYVDKNLEQAYRSYINQPEVIRCKAFLTDIPELKITSMIDHALIDRLESKAEFVLGILKACGNDWNETAYHLLAKNFGFAVNKEPFEQLATLLPYKTLAKHLDHPDQIHALIYGVAGFLDNEADDYQRSLKSEFEFLRKKYQLQPMLWHQWKFSKLRPPNFPTVRLAQFVQILLAHQKLFAFFIAQHSAKDLVQKLRILLGGYWKNHYDFGKEFSIGKNSLGKSSIENVLINTAVPLLSAYSKFVGDQRFMDQAVGLLESLRPESNRITKAWNAVAIQPKTAFDSQALIQQYNEFCLKKKCLHCNIGVAILQRQ